MTLEAELSQVRLKVKLKTSSVDEVVSGTLNTLKSGNSLVWTGAVLLLHYVHVHYVQPVFYSCSICFKYAQRLVREHCLFHIHHK